MDKPRQVPEVTERNESELEERYREALDYLTGLTKFGMNFGLARICGLLERLGNPERGLRVIHIGGTNGKGSTTAITAAILREAGYKVGAFTSPHLHDYRERMTINGQKIPKETVIEFVYQLRPHLEELVAAGMEHPTEFEVHTAIALLYFAKEKVDFAIFEVGLGGEIDSTNVVHPLISVITNVGIDHMDYLGSDLVSITKVKAGIIKPGSNVVTASEKPEVLEVLQQRTAEVGVKLWQVGTDVRWESRWSGEVEQEFDYFGLHAVYPKLCLHLTGIHQLKNAAAAMLVCELLQSEYGVRIGREAFFAGLRKVQWPGRLELLSTQPRILLDGAHNVDGAKVLAAALPLYPRRRLILCLGMLADKEREKVMAILAPLADEIVITKPNSPRAGNWQALAECAEKMGKPVTKMENPREAVLIALGKLEPQDMLCVTGSLYMLAEARETLINQLNN